MSLLVFLYIETPETSQQQNKYFFTKTPFLLRLRPFNGILIMSKSFSSKLLDWYETSKRDLPWRRTTDPYRIWISEIMLQQTTVSAVIPYYDKWMRRFPEMKSLAEAEESEVMNCWEGLGYYSRARNIYKAAKIMVRDHGATVPDDKEALVKLPGFGPYTAGAVLSIAYGQREPIIDANIRRVVMRLNAIRGKADSSQDRRVLPLVARLRSEKRLSEFNQAFMELGALVCGRQPQCLRCPVRAFCLAHAQGIQDEIPVPKKVEYVDIRTVCAVLRRGSRYYLTRKTDKGVLAGLWEFPSRECQEDGKMEECVARMLIDIGVADVSPLSEIGSVRHYYTNHRVKLHAYQCETACQLREDDSHRWVTLVELQD